MLSHLTNGAVEGQKDLVICPRHHVPSGSHLDSLMPWTAQFSTMVMSFACENGISS